MNPGAQLGEKGEAFPALLEYRQKCPNFGEKGPMHILVKFFIQNIDLKISRRKKSKIFLGGGFFLVFLEKQQREMFCKKGVLNTFVNFIGIHLCWIRFLIKVQALGLR